MRLVANDAAEALVGWRTVAVWSGRSWLRSSARTFTHTALGRFSVLAAALGAAAAARPVRSLLAHGAWGTRALSPAAAQGALLLGHASLLLTFCALFAATLVRALVLRPDRAALHAHPVAVPAAALLRVAGAWASAAGAALAVFYLFHWHLVARADASAALVLAVHASATLAVLAPAGLLVGAAVRRLLGTGTIERRARAVHLAGAGGAWLAFAAPSLLPGLGTPGARFLARVGGGGTWMPPQAAVRLLAEGRWAELGILIVSLALVAAAAAPGFVGWAAWAAAELPVDLAADSTRRHASAFDGAHRPRSPVALFWAKDVVLPLRRAPLRAVAMHSAIVATAVTALTCAKAAWPGHGLSALAATLAAAAAALAVAPAALGCLGMEGGPLWLLRAALRPATLFRAKALACVGRGAAAGAMHGAAIGLAARLLGTGAAGPLTLAGVGAAAGALFGFCGAGLGFLLPDFGRGGIALPGATRAGAALYTLIAAASLGAVGTIAALAAHHPATAAVAAVAAAAASALVSATVSAAGIARLRWREG